MPSHPTIWKWEQTIPSFATAYARAREQRASALAEEALTIADGVGHLSTSEAVQAAKLQVDTRKWFAAKLNPRIYSEAVKVDANVSINFGDIVAQAAALRRNGGGEAPE